MLLACGLLPAATINTTLTVNATAPISTTSLTATGTATLTGIGDGTFTSTLSLTSISGTNLTAPYTITLSNGSDSLSGVLSIPAALLTGATTATGSATVTGGTGAYSGATGSFPSLSGSGGISATGITLTFSGAGTINTGGTTGPPTPKITSVTDAAGYKTGVAEGSIFVVKGTNLSASGYTPFSFPLPTTSGGVTITFTPAAGGTGTPAYLIYTYNQSGVNQLAAVLPSNLAPGSYNVTVTNNGATSAPFAATVVQSKLELFTQDSSGSGLAVVQNFISAAQLDVDRLTTGTVAGITISPAKPGQTLIAWGTGMGPVTTGDNNASPGYDFSANGATVKIIVGGETIAPLYAGRAPGLAGADQINFTLPSDVQTGCTVPMQVSVNGVLSNPTYISIAPNASANACVLAGFTTAQLAAFDQGGTFTAGGFSIIQISETVPSTGTIKFDEASGAFTQYTGFQLAAIPPTQTAVASTGACQVFPLTSGTQGQVSSGSGTNLDAGAVTLTGPAGSNVTNLALTETNNTYSVTIGEEGLPAGTPGIGNGTIVAGTYTLTGAGGKDVGKFTASLTLGTPLTITGGLPTTVTRSSPLTLNWTGGNATDLVEIVGYAETSSGSGASTTLNGAEFFCTTTAGAGTFTVPASILQQLPAVSAAAIGNGTGSGFLEVISTVNPTTGNGFFSAPLTAGGTIGNAYFLGLLGVGGSPVYQ